VALTNEQLGTMAAVLVILFAVIVFNNVLAAQARIRARNGGTAAASGKSSSSTSSEPVDPLLVKFARHEGSVVGETVALDGEALILKQAGAFKSVARSQAEVEGEEVVLTGPIDWRQAEADGAAWHAKNRAAAIPEVSGTLTRSEDVKAPAMESTKDR
jgi:hypothetical protein